MHNCVSDKGLTIIAWHSHNQGAYTQQGIMGADWGWCVCVCVAIPLQMERRCGGLRSCGRKKKKSVSRRNIESILLNLASYAANNEPVMTSVLPRIFGKNAQRRHGGGSIQLIVLYRNTLQAL